jgi:succinoglycan biosynthesis transport protein ExoP
VSQDSDELNIARGLGLLRRRGLWIVLCLALAGVAAFGFSKRQTKKYTATASIVFNSSQLSQEIAGLSSTSNDLLLQQANNLELLHLGDLTVKTAQILGHGLTVSEVSSSLSIEGQTESSIASVAATNASPRLAAGIANTYARQFVKEQRTANRRYFKSALTVVEKQLAALSPQQKAGASSLALQDRLQSLQLLAELQPNTVQLAQEASVPTQPSSPKTSRNTLIGAVIGLFIGIGLALLLERIDPRIRDSKELEAIYRVPLLGVVPRSRSLSRFVRDGEDDPSDIPPAEAEVFHVMRARLRTFSAGREIRTVLVSSAALNEGKTTVARHLAGAAARMGSRVLLLEINLRRPALAQQLGITIRTGLPDVLSGAATGEEATQSIESRTMLDTRTGIWALDVLPAGPSIPPNPVELIESRLMDTLLAQAKFTYDLIVLDTPELASVSDASLLLPKVDAVVIVGVPGRSRRDAAKRLVRMLVNSGAPLVGVVANGIKPSSRDPNFASFGYTRGPSAPNASTSRRAADSELVPSTET